MTNDEKYLEQVRALRTERARCLELNLTRVVDVEAELDRLGAPYEEVPDEGTTEDGDTPAAEEGDQGAGADGDPAAAGNGKPARTPLKRPVKKAPAK